MKVMTLIRTLYIKAMINSLPAAVSKDVMPRLDPTVPSAEAASKSSSCSGCDSVIDSSKIPAPRIQEYKTRLVSAESIL